MHIQPIPFTVSGNENVAVTGIPLVGVGRLSPSPPPPPQVQRIIARKTKSNEEGKYVMKNFLIPTYLLSAFLIGKEGR
jgi:hypothetical protein